MSNLTRGTLWMIGAILSFTTMAIAGREALQGYDTFELMTYRSVLGVVIVAVVLTASGRWGDVRRDRLGQHLMRNSAHFIGQNLWFLAVSLVPLAQVIALEFTSPIWLVLLAPVFLGEPLTKPRLITVLLGFLGVLLVARPDASGLGIGTISAASCAVFFALTNIATKRLTAHEATASIMFWLTFMQLGFGLVLALWDGQMEPIHMQYLPYLALVGIAGLSAHYCLTTALSLAPAAFVIPVDFGRLPLVALLGWLLYAEPLTVWIAIGGALILAGNYINIVTSRQHAHREQ